MNKPLVINMFAGPGAGKSTTAYGVACLLKLHSINAELVTEYAKDVTWRNIQAVLKDQQYMFGKQQHKLGSVTQHGVIAVTDSPLLLALVYAEGASYDFKQNVITRFHEFNNLNFFVKRLKTYNPLGRNQTESEAEKLDDKIENMLSNQKVPYTYVQGDFTGINKVASTVVRLEKHNFMTFNIAGVTD